MIDVSHKFNTLRYAKAEGYLKASPEAIQKIKDKKVPKGDVLEVARAAGIAAAKRTSDWMVFCHPMPLDWVGVSYEVLEDRVRVFGEVRAIWKTGVEMEALAAVMGALLNMYDMLKPIDEDIVIGETRLTKKSGGKSDFRDALDTPLAAAVFVISDSTYEGTRSDQSGKAICDFLETKPVDVAVFEVLPDDIEKISDRLRSAIEKEKVDLIFTTGGTGLGPKDLTPEATRLVIDKEVPGIVETIRRHGKERTPYAMLSREVAGVKDKTVVINLPGSTKGALESMQALFPGLLHAFPMLWGEGHNH